MLISLATDQDQRVTIKPNRQKHVEQNLMALNINTQVFWLFFYFFWQ